MTTAIRPKKDQNWGAKGSSGGPSKAFAESMSSFRSSGGQLDIKSGEDDHSVKQTKPERDLYAAVLERAIEDIRWYHKINERPKVDHAKIRKHALGAHYWIFHDKDGPLTFEVVCAALSLEPDAVRNALVKRNLYIPM